MILLIEKECPEKIAFQEFVAQRMTPTKGATHIHLDLARTTTQLTTPFLTRILSDT